jgi:glycosyltransferase involved in cell wall biosynthesis
MIEAADLIVAGNEYLADFAGDKNKVIVVPTVVDVSKYPIHSRNGNNVTIGWIGSRSTQNYLENIVPVFKKITDRYPQVIVKIVSDEMSSWSSGNVVWERWGKEKEIEQLLSFDIGIMPLMDDPWTRGKCGFKLIQYMATGIPVVCSPVGVNNSIVQNGVNGFFASGTNDWEEKLSLLIEDKNLYNSMAVNSRNIAEKNYNLAHWGTFLSGKIKSIL